MTSGAWPHNYVLIIIIWNDAALGFTELVSICFHYNYPQSIASLLKITNSEFLIKPTLCPMPIPLDSAAVTAFLASSPPPPFADSSGTQKTGRKQTSQGAAESSAQRQPGRACLLLHGAMLLASVSPPAGLKSSWALNTPGSTLNCPTPCVQWACPGHLPHSQPPAEQMLESDEM